MTWYGTYANERLFNTVRNGLTYIYLDGVQGVSPAIPGKEHKLIPYDQAQRMLEKAHHVLHVFETQKAPRGKGGAWLENNTNELRRKIHNAQGVFEGRTPQKMTIEDYRALDRSLGLQTRNMAGKKRRNTSFRSAMPEYPSVSESYAGFQFGPGEYEATHVVNGMAWRLKDEFVSPETMALQAYYDRAVRSQDLYGIKRYGNDLSKSMKNDAARAALAFRQAKR